MNIDEISKIVSDKNNLSESEVARINRVQWKFLLNTIQSGGFDPVNIFYLGKFIKNARYNNDRTKRYPKDCRSLDKQEEGGDGNSRS